MRWSRHLQTLAILALITAGGVVILWQATQTKPDFYAAALTIPPDSAVEAGKHLEQRLVTLQAQLKSHAPEWNGEFTDEQVNGWLTTDLPRRYPQAIPQEVQSPRIRFEDGAIRMAFLWTDETYQAVVSVRVTPILASAPNELILRVDKIRAGSVPLPLDRLLPQIEAMAQQTGLDFEWIKRQGDPIARLSLPLDQLDIDQGVRVERLFIEPGRILVGGSWSPQDAAMDAVDHTQR